MLNSQAIITYQCWYWGYPEGGEGAKVPQNPIRFCHEYCGLCETLYICSASMLDGWLNTFYSYKSEMKYSNDQFELLGVGDCTFTRYFKTTLTLVAVATSVLALRGENHDFSWPLMTQWVDNIGNCNRSVKPQIHLLLSDPTVMMTKMPTIMIIIFHPQPWTKEDLRMVPEDSNLDDIDYEKLLW